MIKLSRWFLPDTRSFNRPDYHEKRGYHKKREGQDGHTELRTI